MRYLIIIALIGCGPSYPYHNITDETNYKVNVTGNTPSYGIGVDDPKGELDLEKLDLTLSNVEQCMQQFADEPISADEINLNECYGGVDLTVHDPLIVKVAPDYTLAYSDFTRDIEQTFHCTSAPARCEEKGLVVTAEHPCDRCRATVQDQTTIITVPRMTVFPAMVITVMTGCLNPWKGRMTTCANPNLVVK